MKRELDNCYIFEMPPIYRTTAFDLAYAHFPTDTVPAGCRRTRVRPPLDPSQEETALPYLLPLYRHFSKSTCDIYQIYMTGQVKRGCGTSYLFIPQAEGMMSIIYSKILKFDVIYML
jgi:hypothetical protein